MRYLLLVCGLLGLAVICRADTPKGFLTSFTAVKQVAGATHKLIFLYFTANESKWCRKIESDTFTDPRVQDTLGTQYCAASLDCSTTKGKTPDAAVLADIVLLRRYSGNDEVPFLVMLDEHGEAVLTTLRGCQAPDALLQALAAARKTADDYQDYLAFAATADKNSYDYALRSMRMTFRVKQYYQADSMARRLRMLDPDNAKGDELEVAWTQLRLLPMGKWSTTAPGKACLADIRRLDPKNRQGILELALWQQAYLASHTHDLPLAISVLKDLTAMAETLKDPQKDYALLGMAQAEHKDTADAIASMEKAVAVNPESEAAKLIQQRIAALKSQPK